VQDLVYRFADSFYKMNPTVMRSFDFGLFKKSERLFVWQGKHKYLEENKEYAACCNNKGIYFRAESFKKDKKPTDKQLGNLCHEAMHQCCDHHGKRIKVAPNQKEFEAENWTIRVLYQMGCFNALEERLADELVTLFENLKLNIYSLSAFNGLAHLVASNSGSKEQNSPRLLQEAVIKRAQDLYAQRVDDETRKKAERKVVKIIKLVARQEKAMNFIEMMQYFGKVFFAKKKGK